MEITGQEPDWKIRKYLQIVKTVTLRCSKCGRLMEMTAPSDIDDEECIQMVKDKAQGQGWKLKDSDWPICEECKEKIRRDWAERFGKYSVSDTEGTEPSSFTGESNNH